MTAMLNIKYSVIRIIFCLLLISSIKAQDFERNTFAFPYDLSEPDEKMILPDVLEEISGNVLLNDNIMICIQDEKGDLYFYDLNEKRLIKKVDFGKDGDYEDLTLVHDKVYALRSNGTLYKISNFEDEEEIEVKEIKTRLSKKNNCEGLCYDPVENRLLIALKGDPEVDEDQDFDGFKAIYSFDIEKEIEQVKTEKTVFIKNQEFEEAASCRDKERELKEKLELTRVEWEKNTSNNRLPVTEEDIADVIATMTGVPVRRVAQNEGEKLGKMHIELAESVIGQNQAIKNISKSIRRNRAGLKDPNRPIGSFIFLGPTGVGKCHGKGTKIMMFDGTI